MTQSWNLVKSLILIRVYTCTCNKQKANFIEDAQSNLLHPQAQTSHSSQKILNFPSSERKRI